MCESSAAEGQAGPSRRFDGGTILDNTELFCQHSRNVDSGSIHFESELEHSETTSNIKDSSPLR